MKSKTILFFFIFCSLKTFSQNSILSKADLTEYYLKANSLDSLEGIYSIVNHRETYFNGALADKGTSINIEVGVYKFRPNCYKVFTINGEGKICVIDSIRKISSSDCKFYFDYNGNKSNSELELKNFNEFIVKNKIISSSYNNCFQLEEMSFEKEKGIASFFPSNTVATGSGFIISNAGYLITNYHVIDGAQKILIKSNANKKFINATIFATDKEYDLAILKINPTEMGMANSIPFKVSKKTLDVGSEILALGYPLITSMGSELKLSEGIINAQSGYTGDTTLYQISAPIQPGNSGGPLFDLNGNLVGVVNAKLTSAENVGYAIKSSVLYKFLQKNKVGDLSSVSSTQTKSLSDNFKTLKNFTFLIITLN